MKLRLRLLSILLCLVLVLGIFPVATTATAKAGIGTLFAGFVFNQLASRTMLAMSTAVAAIGEATGDTETAALINKWVFGITDPSLEAIAKLSEQMVKLHKEVMAELDFINDKLDKNLSGIEDALGSAAVNSAYDNYQQAWANDVTNPMALQGYNQPVNAYKTYLEYAGSYKTGSTVIYGGQEMVATEEMVTNCRDSFYAALIAMSGRAYDANSDMSYDAYYEHILFETNTIDLKIQSTINNLMGRMLNATGAPSGGRYLDRAAQVAFAYFPFSEDQAAFVDAASKKQAHEITMALLAYQEFIGLRLSYCESKYNALKESGASEEELAALQTKIDNYCTPNDNLLQLMAGGAASTYPGGVVSSVNTWLSAPVYISLSDNSYVYLQDYLRGTDTQKFTLTNTNFISQTDPDVLVEESERNVISSHIWLLFDGPFAWEPEFLISSANITAEQMQFTRRGVVVPTEGGRAVVRPIYMLADETQDRSSMLMSNLLHSVRIAASPELFVPNADFYNFRDGVYTDGHNSYTLTTGSRLQAATDYNPLSLGGGLLGNYFKSVIGSYPEGRGLYVLTGATETEDSAYGHKQSGVNMTTTATFLEDMVPKADQASTSYMVVLTGNDTSSVYRISATAPEGMTVSLEGEDYDASAGTAKAGSTVTLTIDPGEGTIPAITAAYHEDTLNPTKVTYEQVLADELTAANLSANDDGTISINYFMPYSNVTLVVGDVSDSICTHPSDKQSSFCNHGTYGTHGIGVTCSNCDTQISYTTEDCYDNNGDDLCDVCGFALVCPHAEEDRLVNMTNHYGTHSIYEHCNGCGTDIRNVTEPCTDEDGDGICDVCNGDAECPHHTNWWQTTAQSNGNETHTITRVCSNCGEVVETGETWPCYDGDNDGMCEDCGYVFWCSHPEEKLTRTMTVSFRKHTINTSCSCGEYSSTVTEDCTDEDGNDYCDICGGYLVCDHSNGTISITCNEDGTHTTQWACGDCGESGSDTGECYDDDNDGSCDICTYDLSEAVCDHPEEKLNTDTTYNNNGTHTVTTTCSCGEYEVSETEYCIDDDGDYLCDICQGNIQLVIIGSNMNLGNELQINFFVPDLLSDKHTYTAHITRSCRGEVKDEILVPKENWTVFDSEHLRVSCRVRAMEMADDLDIVIKDENGRVCSEPYSTSVREYAHKVLVSDTTSEYVKILVVDMVNYGTQAQLHFGYNTEDLANNTLTEEQAALASAEVVCVNGQVKGVNAYGSNLVLNDCILMNMLFKGMKDLDVDTMYAEVTFTNWKDEAKSVTIPGEEFIPYGGSGDIYRVQIDDIVLADAKCLVTTQVFTKDGELHGSCTDSVESYSKRGEETDAAPLYRAIMKFSHSAYNYQINR
ncbi:MAG: hypothetical protein J6J43_08965 [Oscillospiraceae bacterium]|nr:hypothetical protein [Oscillospiraceae bacterium]